MVGENFHLRNSTLTVTILDLHGSLSKKKVIFFFCRNREGGFPLLCCGPPLSVRSRTTKCKKSPERYRSRLLCLYVHILCNNVRGGYCQGKWTGFISRYPPIHLVWCFASTAPALRRPVCLWRTFFQGRRGSWSEWTFPRCCPGR